MSSPPHIDPDELPFTRDEIRRAASLWLADSDACEMADLLAEQGPFYIAERQRRREAWHAAGIPNAQLLPLSAWGYPEWLLPALTALTPSCEARARTLMAKRWESDKLAYLHAIQTRAAESAGVWPTRDQVLAKLAQQTKPERTHEGLAVQLPPLPPPTPAMLDEARRRITDDMHAWEALVNEAHRRLRALSTGQERRP